MFPCSAGQSDHRLALLGHLQFGTCAWPRLAAPSGFKQAVCQFSGLLDAMLALGPSSTRCAAMDGLLAERPRFLSLLGEFEGRCWAWRVVSCVQVCHRA